MMRKSGRAVSVTAGAVSLSVDGNAGASVAACCTVPTVVLEAKNPKGVEVRPGDLVEISDGLGVMALGASSFLVLPSALYFGATSLLNLWWWGALAAVAGLFAAILFFKSLNVGQYPRVVGRVGWAVDESSDKEYL